MDQRSRDMWLTSKVWISIEFTLTVWVSGSKAPGGRLQLTPEYYCFGWQKCGNSHSDKGIGIAHPLIFQPKYVAGQVMIEEVSYIIRLGEGWPNILHKNDDGDLFSIFPIIQYRQVCWNKRCFRGHSSSSKIKRFDISLLTLWSPLLPYGYSYKASCGARPG